MKYARLAWMLLLLASLAAGQQRKPQRASEPTPRAGATPESAITRQRTPVPFGEWLQNKIDAIAAGNHGGLIQIPPGTHLLDRPITIEASGVHIQGAGMRATRIQYTGPPTTAILDIGNSETGDEAFTRELIENLTISGSSNAQIALRLRSIHRSAFRHLSLINVSYAGLATRFAVSNLYDDIHVSANEGAFSVVAQHGIVLDGPDLSHAATASTILQPVIEGVSGAGIVLASAAGIEISGGTSENNGAGISIGAAASHIHINTVDLESNSGPDLVIDGDKVTLTNVLSTSEQGVVIGSSARGTTVVGTTVVGAFTDNGTGTTVVGNIAPE